MSSGHAVECEDAYPSFVHETVASTGTPVSWQTRLSEVVACPGLFLDGARLVQLARWPVGLPDLTFLALGPCCFVMATVEFPQRCEAAVVPRMVALIVAVAAIALLAVEFLIVQPVEV